MTGSTMSFDVRMAQKYGLNAAVFLNNLIFWLEKNAIDGRNVADGKVWTYNTHEDYCSLMPFFNKRQVKYVIQVLKVEGVILVDQPEGFHRRSWITVADNAMLSEDAVRAISHGTKLSHRRDENGESKGQNRPLLLNDTDGNQILTQSSRAREDGKTGKTPAERAVELAEIRRIKDSLTRPS